MEPDDPLDHAERQMIEHEVAVSSELGAKFRERYGLDGVPADEMPAAIERLIAEDPEASELLERLAALVRFRRGE